MNSGGLRGAKGTMASGPTFLVAERGPALRKTFGFTSACRDVSNQGCTGVATPNF